MDTTTENGSLRDELESSFEAAAQDTTSTAEAPPAESPPPESETPEQKAQREYVRDELGKFAPKEDKGTPQEQKPPVIGEKPLTEGIKSAPKAGQPPASGQPPVDSKEHFDRAPQAWKPEAREYWKDIPPAARAEIMRHEQQVQATLRETVEVRRFAEAVSKAVEPYRGTIEAEGSNVVAAIGSLLQTAQALRTAPPPHKAQLVADMVKQFGIDIQQLDQALAGKVANQEPPEILAMRQQLERELAPVRQWQQQMMMQQQMMEQQKAQQAQQQIVEFSKNAEFINDVRYLMADIIDIREKNGLPYTLEEVYKAACQAHPEVSKVMQQRAQVSMAQNMNSTAQRAKQAAVSVGGSPALGAEDKAPGDSIRDSIMFALNQSVR